MAAARRITAATLAIPALIAVAVLVASSLFIVDEREQGRGSGESSSRAGTDTK